MDSYAKYFRIKRIGTGTYYVVRKGQPYYRPVSPDFQSSAEAYSWIKAHWKELMFEEVVLT